jgi:hypothetical protein
MCVICFLLKLRAAVSETVVAVGNTDELEDLDESIWCSASIFSRSLSLFHALCSPACSLKLFWLPEIDELD